MRKVLIVVGYQEEKLQFIGKKRQKLEDWIVANQGDYDYTISIVRDAGNRNMRKSGTEIINSDTKNYYPFSVEEEIIVTGYDIDTSIFDINTEYHIVGVSTGASVLCIAMSMYSEGLNVRVLENYCFDRMGLHKEAIKLMSAYMKDCVLK